MTRNYLYLSTLVLGMIFAPGFAHANSISATPCAHAASNADQKVAALNAVRILESPRPVNTTMQSASAVREKTK